MRSAADPMACVSAELPPSIFGRAKRCEPTAQSTDAVTTLTPDGSPGTFADCPKRFPPPTDARSDPSTETKATGDAGALGGNRGSVVTDVSATLCGEWRMGGSGDGGGARLGWGFLKSCAGVWPKLTICDSAAARASGSLTALRSTDPSYVSGWKTLRRFTLSSPRCAWPNTRSIHRCILAETVSDSRASRMMRMNSCGEPLAHGGNATSPTDAPFWVAPRLKPLEFARNSGRE
mmetsp:Transcript_10113/g.41739  ORF Transcript_10113/g.41739 Transcript_10113/m.41739 type:complete len:234 (-) Transcript_10113:4008-4709(-)